MKRILHRQRRMGLVLAVCGVLTAVVAGGDITAALVLVPLGVGLMCTKEAVLYEAKKRTRRG